jgi:hypothetical protein
MGRRYVLGVLLLCACQAQLGTGDRPSPDASAPIDSSQTTDIDAGVDSMVQLGPWGTPAAVLGASSTTLAEDDATLSSNKLELYFKRPDAGDNNLYVMTRASVADPWSAPTALPATLVNTTASEESPRLSSDDLTMYFGRAGEIYKTVRTNTTSPWQMATIVTPLNTAANEKWADVCSGGYAIVSRAVTGQGQELFEGTVTAGAPTALTNQNTANNEQGTLLTADCLRLYFQSDRDGTFDIFMASRTSVTGAWSNPTKLPDFNTAAFNEEDAWISTDQRTFVFSSNANGTKDVFISTR